MALPIGATPVLQGKDARRFQRYAKVNRTRCAPEAEVRRAINVFIAVMKKIK